MSLIVLPPSAFNQGPGKAKMGKKLSTKTRPTSVRKILRRLHHLLQILPTSKRRMLYERLREKVANDILAVMQETETPLEMLAAVMGLKKAEMREWIWERDLTLSELSRMLNKLDSEAYFIIRPRKLRGDL